MPADDEAEGHAGNAPPRPAKPTACRSPRWRSPGNRLIALDLLVFTAASDAFHRRLAGSAAWTCISGQHAPGGQGADRRRSRPEGDRARRCRWHG